MFTIYIESGQFKYSSDEFVISSRGPAAYHYIYIIDEPDPEIPISVPITEMNPEGTINCKNDDACSKDSISTVPCGERCWSTKDKLLTLNYKFKGSFQKLENSADLDFSQKQINSADLDFSHNQTNSADLISSLKLENSADLDSSHNQANLVDLISSQKQIISADLTYFCNQAK